MEEGTRWKLTTKDINAPNTEAVITGADVLTGLNDSVVEHSASFAARDEQLDEDENDISLLTTQEKLCLSSWGLPETILERYASRGVVSMFPWQLRCLQQGEVLSGRNLVYSAPTSAGKTLVAEILAIKTVLERRKKVIFVLPFVSVVREKMHYFQNLLSTSGVRVAGLMGSQSLPGGFSRVHMAICTIEKANSLVNRLLEQGTLDSLGALVVDELHLIGDPFRGYLLELLLAKVKFVAERQGLDIQIIGMSATLPNLDHLAQWLDAELFTTDYRPVPLQELFKCGDEVYDRNLRLLYRITPQIKINNDPDHVIHMCLETVTNGHSALIFCPTKVWCESLATSLASNVRTLGCGTGPLAAQLRAQLVAGPLTELLSQLRSCAAGLDAVLGRCVQYGVAFHHAGLTMDERDILEAGFRRNVLRLLVATSTLSSGVNLPARRVIVRTAQFHGKPLEAAAYHQMAGRAGRTGCDTQGESFLMFKSNEMAALRRMVAEKPAAVRSCLEPPVVGLASSMKRALLEVIAGGVANTMEELRHFVSCTLMGCVAEAERAVKDEVAEDDETVDSQKAGDGRDRWPIQAYIAFLLRNELVRRQEAGEGDDKCSRLVSTALGGACLASALHPDEALALFRELQRARQSFVLENDLHVVYLVTPYSVAAQLGNLDWMQVLRVWKRLTPDLKRVGTLVGVREATLAAGAAGGLPADGADVALVRRFHTALALLALLDETPLARVAAEFGCSRGLLQALQQGAATYAGVVRAFCSRLRWHTVERLVEEFAPRLELGVARELLPLARLELVDGPRARALYDAGFTSLPALAGAQGCDVETALMAATPFQSCQGMAGESAYDAARRQQRRLVCLTGHAGVTERQAAEMLIQAAQQLVQRDLELATEALMPVNRPHPITPTSLRNVSALSECDGSQAETLPLFIIGVQGEKKLRAAKKFATSKSSHKSPTSRVIAANAKDLHATAEVNKIPITAEEETKSDTHFLDSPSKNLQKSFNLPIVSENKGRLSFGFAGSNGVSGTARNKKQDELTQITDSLDLPFQAPREDILEKHPLLPTFAEAGHKSSESETSIDNTPPSTRTSKRMKKIMQHRSNADLKYMTILPSPEVDDSPEICEDSSSEISGNSCDSKSSRMNVGELDSAKFPQTDTSKVGLVMESEAFRKNCIFSAKNDTVQKNSSPTKLTLATKLSPSSRNTKSSLGFQSPLHSVKSPTKFNQATLLACSTPETADALKFPTRHTPDIVDIPPCGADLFLSPLELPNLTAMMRLENGLACSHSLGESGNLSARSRVSIDMFDSPSPLPCTRSLSDRKGLTNVSPPGRGNRALQSPSCLPQIGNRSSDSPLMTGNAACRLSLGSRKSSLFGDSLVLESQFDSAVAVPNGQTETVACDVSSDTKFDSEVKDPLLIRKSPIRVNTEPMMSILDSMKSKGVDNLVSTKIPNILNNLSNTSEKIGIEWPTSDLKVDSCSLFQSFAIDTQFHLVMDAINKNEETENHENANKKDKSELKQHAITENLKTELDRNVTNCDNNDIPKQKFALGNAPEQASSKGSYQILDLDPDSKKYHSKVSIQSSKTIKSSTLNFEDSLNIDTQLNFVLNSENNPCILKSLKSTEAIETIKISPTKTITSNHVPTKSTSINFEGSLTLDTQLNLVLNSLTANPTVKSSPERAETFRNKSPQSSPEMFEDSLPIDTQLGLAIDDANRMTLRTDGQKRPNQVATKTLVQPRILGASCPPKDNQNDQRPLASTTTHNIHRVTTFVNKSFKSPILTEPPQTLQKHDDAHVPVASTILSEKPSLVVNNESIVDESTFFEESSVSDELDANIDAATLENTSVFAQESGSALDNVSLEDVVMCTPPSTISSSKSFALGGKRKKKRKLSPEVNSSSKKMKESGHEFAQRGTKSCASLESSGPCSSTANFESKPTPSGVRVSSSDGLERRRKFSGVASGKELGKQSADEQDIKMKLLSSTKNGGAKRIANNCPVGETEKLVSKVLTVRWCSDLDLDGSWQRLESALESVASVALALACEPALKKSGPLIGSAILGRRSITSENLVPSSETVVTGFALSFGAMEAFFVPLELGSGKRASRGLRLLQSLRHLRVYGAQEQLTTLLRSCHLVLNAQLFDPLVADWLVDSSNTDPGLLVAAQRECDSPSELLALLGRLPRADMKSAPHPRPLRAALEAVCTWHLSEFRRDRLKDVDLDVVDVEMSVLPILAAADCAGLGVDCSSKSRLRIRITAAITRHPTLARKCRAMLAALNGLGLADRVHPRSDPLGVTGRITMHTPNVQCVPRDIALPHEAPLSLRSIFVAPPGSVLVAADFCQLELRLLAHLSGDQQLHEAVTVEGDAFAQLAASWNRVPTDQVSDEQRSMAKAACYGLIYGMGTRALADKLGVELEQAVDVVQQFNAAFPGAASFVEQTQQQCRETGYVTTLCGRRRYLPAISSTNSEERSSAERQAVNSTIQGSAADVFKRAMVSVSRLLPPGAKIVLHLHDELMVQEATARVLTRIATVVPSKDVLSSSVCFAKVGAASVRQAAEALKLGMSRAVSLSVPLPVKVTSGPTWADQKLMRG